MTARRHTKAKPNSTEPVTRDGIAIAGSAVKLDRAIKSAPTTNDTEATISSIAMRPNGICRDWSSSFSIVVYG